MAANLKGNLGLKSSPLAPTACKLSTQYLVLDHMTNHYNKIAKAKSAIDSKPPKSLSTSQKLRDRKNRDKIAKSPRTRPATSMSHDSFHVNQEFFNDEPEDEEDRLVHTIMKTTLLDKDDDGTNHLEGKSLFQDYVRNTYSARPGSARSVQSGHSLGGTSQRLTTTTHDPAKLTYQGDLLDKRPYLFTEPERPFTPRTLKNNHQSRLKNSKCYNPPPKKNLPQQVGRQQRSGALKPQPAPEVRTGPRPRPRMRGQTQEHAEHMDKTVRRDSFHGLGDTIETTGQLSESMLMDITLQSRDGRQRQLAQGGDGATNGQAQGVPPLAISMDEDQMKWLQEQASKAQVRARSTAQIKASSLHSDKDAAVHRQTVERERTPSEKSRNGPLRESIKRETLQKDEDQKYLAFTKEVTDDVLSRGICTDSVLNRVFENHIERRKETLDEDRMRQVIRDLRKDLGLRDSSAERTPHAALNSHERKREMMPVTVVTNGETGSSGEGSNNQLPSGSSKATTTSTSAKDESSSSLSPAVHYRGIMKGGTSSLEPLQVMSSPSENGVGLTSSATLESVSSFKFGQTGDMVDTITTEAILEDTAREREEEEEERGLRGGEEDDTNDELSATQALKQYEFDLTVKEGTAEVSTTPTGNNSGKDDESEGTVGRSGSNSDGSRAKRGQRRDSGMGSRSKLERPATGERRFEEDGEERRSSTSSQWERTGSESSHPRQSRRQREGTPQQRRQEASETPLSHTVSYSTTENNTKGGGMNGDSSGTAVSESNNKHFSNDNEDAASVKSSSSLQVPKVRPRTRIAQARDKTDEESVGSPARTEQSQQEGEGQGSHQLEQTTSEHSKADDYEDDYEEDEDIEEDVDETTHRTSDDDF